MKIYSEELYDFVGHEMAIRSNSIEALTHLRAVYGRFFQGKKDILDAPETDRTNPFRLIVEIIDDFDNTNEMLIKDTFYAYRITRTNGSYRYKCRDVKGITPEYVGTCNLLHFIQTLILRTLTLMIKDLHLFHAGAVAWKDRGMIFPAHPDMGKTTMVVKLVMEGCKFLSDEIACLHPELNVLEAFPRRVSIRNQSRKILGLPPWSEVRNVIKTYNAEAMLDIEDLVPNSLIKRATPKYLFFIQGIGDRSRLDQVSSSYALFELIKYVYSTVEDSTALIFKIAPLLDKMNCYNLLIGEINETAELVISEVQKEEYEDG